jgi:hypothetical protein
MRAVIVAIALFLASPAAQAEVRSWNFRVLLDDRDIGQHRFTLVGSGPTRELSSEARFDVRLLFINAYRYRHEALERWNGNCLQSLVSRTETNGASQSVTAAARGNRLSVERPEGSDEHEGCVMSFAYWNPQILRERRLLNSQTGELLPVSVTPEGEETVHVHGQRFTAQRYRIRAPSLEIDLWYAGERWIRLEAPAQGGRRLRYEPM